MGYQLLGGWGCLVLVGRDYHDVKGVGPKGGGTEQPEWNLREPWGVLEKIGEYCRLLGCLPP